MTATPIPRTVAMTVFGDLDVSTLTELPAGRPPIATHVVPPRSKPHSSSAPGSGSARRSPRATRPSSCCPRIGDELGDRRSRRRRRRRRRGRSAAAGRRSPCSTSRRQLAEGPLAGLRVERAARPAAQPDEKDDVMRRVRRRRDSTCWSRRPSSRSASTSRTPPSWSSWTPTGSGSRSCTSCAAGSVAGGAPGLCLLVTDAPKRARPARQRLDAVAATLDGFELSRLDLEQRREGDVLGASQSGRRSSLRLLRVIRDEERHRAGPRRTRPRLVDRRPRR